VLHLVFYTRHWCEKLSQNRKQYLLFYQTYAIM
jgi:hypothetical protein